MDSCSELDVPAPRLAVHLDMHQLLHTVVPLVRSQSDDQQVFPNPTYMVDYNKYLSHESICLLYTGLSKLKRGLLNTVTDHWSLPKITVYFAQ